MTVPRLRITSKHNISPTAKLTAEPANVPEYEYSDVLFVAVKVALLFPSRIVAILVPFDGRHTYKVIFIFWVEPEQGHLADDWVPLDRPAANV
jgi:hypothetical protein